MRARFFALLSPLILAALAPCAWAATLEVNTLADELNVPAGANLSLREAVRDATAGDTIRFAAGLNGGTLALTRGSIVLAKNLIIDAMSLSEGLAISGSPSNGIFGIQITVSATLKGLTLTRGSNWEGGAILNRGTLLLENCWISGCTALNNGSAIYHDGTKLTMRQCAVTANGSSNDRASIYIGHGSATLINCTVANNESLGSSAISMSNEDASIHLNHCTVVDHRGGGGVYAGDGTLRLENSLLARNMGGISSGSPPRISDLQIVSATVQKIGENFISSNFLAGPLFPAGPTVGTATSPLDPHLSPLNLHGGRTPSFLPLAGAPAINLAIATEESPQTDQRGYQRTVGSQADLGAIEGQMDDYFPADGSSEILLEPTLEWSQPTKGETYTVMFGSSPETLAPVATRSIGHHTLPKLSLGSTYHWRIDRTSDGNTVTGPILSFTTRTAIVVDKAADESASTAPSLEGTSFREAVLIANGRPGLDVIRFAPSLAGSEIPINLGRIDITSELQVEGGSVAGGITFSRGSFRIRAATEFEDLSLIRGGSATLDGVISVESDFVAKNCTFSENRASKGAGIGLKSGNCSLIHCTITRNKAYLAGGGIHQSGGNLTLENCIVAGNESWRSSPDLFLSSSPNLRGQNLIGNNSGSEALLPASPLTGTATAPIFPVVALVGPYVAGGAWHCPLMANSPALDAAPFLLTSPSSDQLGNARPGDLVADLGAVSKIPELSVISPGNGQIEVDLGHDLYWSTPGDSFEIFWGTSATDLQSIGVTPHGFFALPGLAESTTYYWRVDTTTGGTAATGMMHSFTTRAPIIVTTLTDELDTNPADGSGISLREALSIANSRAEADRITFDPLLSGRTLTLTRGLLNIASDCLVESPTPDKPVTIHLNGENRYLLTGGRAELTLRGINVTGFSSDSSFSSAIFADSPLSLQNLSIHGNSGFEGAAVECSSLFNAENCSFFDNHSIQDGGALNLRGPDARLVNCTLAGNSAGMEGGAIYCFRPLTLDHCTITGNTAESGGGIKTDDNEFTLRNSIVAGNIATDTPANSDILAASLTNLKAEGTNLIGINNGVEPRFPTGPLAGTLAAPLAAKLSPLTNHGGHTRTMVPLPGSPAIDAAATLAGAPASDQRGLPRPLGAAPDLGSVEAFPIGLAIVDSDGDGMDDRLEALFGFTVGLPDGLLDSDRDGSSNADELGNRSHPHDSGDFLRVLAIPSLVPGENENGPTMSVTWATSPGLHYTIELSEQLDFAGEELREIDAGTADGFNKTLEIPLQPGRDFLRIRRD